jgi:hypothetical protein
VSKRLSLSVAARRSGQSVARLRRWCATGELTCDRDRNGWYLFEQDLPRLALLAARRERIASEQRVIALTVPKSSPVFDLAGLVERHLVLPPGTVSSTTVAIDGEDHLVAIWPSVHRAPPEALATLAALVGGDLLGDAIDPD